MDGIAKPRKGVPEAAEGPKSVQRQGGGLQTAAKVDSARAKSTVTQRKVFPTQSNVFSTRGNGSQTGRNGSQTGRNGSQTGRNGSRTGRSDSLTGRNDSLTGRNGSRTRRNGPRTRRDDPRTQRDGSPAWRKNPSTGGQTSSPRVQDSRIDSKPGARTAEVALVPVSWMAPVCPIIRSCSVTSVPTPSPPCSSSSG